MTSGTRPVSIVKSVRTEKSVRADSESAWTVMTVKADSRLVRTEESVRASPEQLPATPSGWSGPVVPAGTLGPASQSRHSAQTGYASQSGYSSQSGPASQARPTSQFRPASQSSPGPVSQPGSGLISSGRTRIAIGRARPAWRMEPLTPPGPPTDPRPQATSTRWVIWGSSSPPKGGRTWCTPQRGGTQEGDCRSNRSTIRGPA